MAGWKDLIGTLQSTFRITKLLEISASGLTVARTYTLPDVSGQLALKAPFGASTLTNNTVATTETVVARWSIPANRLAAGDNLDLKLIGDVSSTATLAFKIRMGTTGTITDALVCTFITTAAGAANQSSRLEAFIAILTATTATALGSQRLAGAEIGIVVAAFAAANVNLAVANFISVTLVQSAAQTFTSRAAKLSL